MKNFSYIHVERLNDMGRGKKGVHCYRPRKNSRVVAKSYTRLWGVEGCWMHDMRTIETANADKNRFKENVIVCEETGWKAEKLTKETIKKTGCRNDDFISKKVNDYIAKNHTGDKIRDNAVRACMLLSAVSPQYLRDMSQMEWDDYQREIKMSGAGKLKPLNDEKVVIWERATIKFYRKKFGDRVMAIVFHYDESNPHCTVYIVPMIEKTVTKRGNNYKDPNRKRETRVVKTLCAKEIFTPDDNIWQPGKMLENGTKTRGEYILLARGTCSLMQDEYANHLREYGLEVRRGNRRSANQLPLEHEENRVRYDRSQTAIEEIKALPDSELRPFLEAKAANMADADRLRIERDHHQIIAADNQERAHKLELKTTELELKISDSQRELSVTEVISKLTGLDPIEPDEGPMPPGPGSPPKNKRKDIQSEFLLPDGMRLGITNQNGFENLTPDVPFLGKNAKRLKGKGALDAIMFLTGWEFTEASAWIADNFSTEEAAKVVTRIVREDLNRNRDDDDRVRRKNHAEIIAHNLETPDKSQWEATKQALLRTFKFREAVIDSQHNAKWIEANKYGHLVFMKGNWDENNHIISTGKIIVDPKNPTVTLKETGDNGLYFDIDQQATKVVICSSPMDALAIRSTPEHYASTVVVVGKNPSDKTIAAIGRIVKKHRGIKVLAENLTAAGQRLAAWMHEHFPQIETLPLPKGFQNWLDYHRPRLKSDSADLRVVEFPKEDIGEDQEMSGP